MSMTTALTQDQINALRLLHDTGVLDTNVRVLDFASYSTYPWHGLDVKINGGRYYLDSPGGHRRDITEEYYAWVETGVPTVQIAKPYQDAVDEALS